MNCIFNQLSGKVGRARAIERDWLVSISRKKSCWGHTTVLKNCILVISVDEWMKEKVHVDM